MLIYTGRKYNFLLNEIKKTYTNFQYIESLEFNINNAITDYLNPTYSKIIIELDSLTNTNDELINAFKKIKQFNSNIDLSIIAVGYSNKSEFIRQLKMLEYNNIYISQDEHDISSIKEFIIKTYFKDDIKIINNIFEDEELTNLAKKLDESLGKGKQYNEEDYITQHDSFNTIGIIGANRGIGTTTQALQLVKFLQFNDISASYIELNDTNYVYNLTQLYNTEEDNNHNIIYNNINLFNKIEDIQYIKSNDYQYCIVDYGALTKNTYIPSFLEKDIKICVCGFKPNEFPYFRTLFKEMIKYDGIYYIFSFIAKSEQKEILELFNNSGGNNNNVYFADFTPDPFSFNPNSNTFYNKIIHYNNLNSNNQKNKKNKKLRKLFNK